MRFVHDDSMQSTESLFSGLEERDVGRMKMLKL